MGGGGWRPLSLPRPLTRSLGSVPTDPRPLLCPQLGRELAGWAPRPRFPSTLGAALSFWPRKILRARRVPPPPALESAVSPRSLDPLWVWDLDTKLRALGVPSLLGRPRSEPRVRFCGLMPTSASQTPCLLAGTPGVREVRARPPRVGWLGPDAPGTVSSLFCVWVRFPAGD